MSASLIRLAKQAVVDADLDLKGFKLTNLSAPTNDNDVTRKVYVDNAISAAVGAIVIPVTKVFDRVGDVVATDGDYTASQVTNVPAGNVAAVTVQAAINELDGDKLDIHLADGFLWLGDATGVAAPRRLVTREAPVADGALTVFTLALTPVTGSESVFLNGQLLEPGAGNDYTIAAKAITFPAALAATDKVRVNYLATA